MQLGYITFYIWRIDRRSTSLYFSYRVSLNAQDNGFSQVSTLILLTFPHRTLICLFHKICLSFFYRRYCGAVFEWHLRLWLIRHLLVKQDKEQQKLYHPPLTDCSLHFMRNVINKMLRVTSPSNFTLHFRVTSQLSPQLRLQVVFVLCLARTHSHTL